MNGNVLFEIKDLQKKFGSLTVFDGLNETIYKGDVVVIIGPSGGGKSTFIRCLNLLEQPTSGKIYFVSEIVMFSSTVRLLKRLNCWNTMPTFCRCLFTSKPLTVMSSPSK